MIIGITGTDGAGKGTIVEYLVKEKGFAHYSARSLFLAELKKQDRGTTRSDMRLVANELRAKYGDDFVVRTSLEKAAMAGENRIIIESIRAVAEAETLKKEGGILVAVDADQKLRYERVQERRSSADQVTFEEFKRHEELENNDPDPHGMQKGKVIAMAHYRILNNGTFDELRQEIETKLAPLFLQ